MTYAKGHGTGNDFVILPDLDGTLPLTPRLVAALCDRRRGIGADGVLRVVRTDAHPDAARYAGAAEWFMDYWNADGTFAEMCGNGVRVYSRYLVEAGFADGGELTVATRAGVVRVVVTPAEISAGLSKPRVYGQSVARVAGYRYLGEAVDVGNPHLVCRVSDTQELAGLDLTTSPEFSDADFPTGVNVEFSAPGVPLPGVDAHVRMRVYERGSGETLSCGSGACAVAAVALADVGLSTGRVAVDVPGGRLTITLDEETCWLAGPAVIVATGAVAPEALDVRLPRSNARKDVEAAKAGAA
ncbi:diaminopimelate epimerase [Planosporangium flavigriseum]|uniref:Diaminopimelate epimerase n=1 Tax=Planosporangium flavigriseum TaxID=373681 RepID=A0A8J3LRZ6_9ACTN|nr:diaminopimelate epimerase [Planosporangium flavigriseum]NJC63999.1 diaminopimelate epimerase [Planosporangium flavigriseum]GIG72879.1 diaminopimelate epimerase [Planosporangium flavigriseum]